MQLVRKTSHCDNKLIQNRRKMANSSVHVLILMISIFQGIYSEHNFIGQTETFHLQNVPDNLQICSPHNVPILSKTGTSCRSLSPLVGPRVDIQECSNRAVVFILSDLRTSDSGIYQLCQQPSTWSHKLDVQGYPVEVTSDPMSPVVKDGDNVTLTCKYSVPQNIDNVRVKWTVENIGSGKVQHWYSVENSITVYISLTNDCDMYTCQLFRDNVQISTSNKPPFKINKIDKSEVSYTGSSITFIIPAKVFENGRTFYHSSGCCYHFDNQESDVTKCTECLAIHRNRIYTSMEEDRTVYITLENSSPFDSGMYRVGDGSAWKETLLVWGYESSIVASPRVPVYGGQLTLTCVYDLLQPNFTVTEFRWWKTTKSVSVLLNNTEQAYSVGSYLTELDQDNVYQCRPVFKYLGFSPSSQYTVNMFIPPRIKSYTINGTEENFQVDDGEPIRFNCDWISSFPVTSKYYLTHDPTREPTGIVDLTRPINASCDMDGTWTCHVSYEYNIGNKTIVLEDRKNITLVVNKCVAMIETNETQLKLQVKVGESVEVRTRITGTMPNVTINGLPVLSRSASGIPPISATVESRHLVVHVNMANADVFGENLTVTVSNEFGNDTIPINIQPIGGPQPPSDLTVLEISGDHVTIQWQPQFRGGSNQSIIIEHRNSSSDWSILDTLPSDDDTKQTYSHIATFVPGTPYDYRVKGFNQQGESAYSNVLSVFVGNGTMDQVDNTILYICITVGAVAILVFSLVMAVLCTRRRKAGDERLLTVEDIHRSSESTSAAEESRESRGVSELRASIDSDPSSGTSTQDHSGSQPTIGSSETQYVQNAGTTTTVQLPRLSTDYRAPATPPRRVHFPHSD